VRAGQTDHAASAHALPLHREVTTENQVCEPMSALRTADEGGVPPCAEALTPFHPKGGHDFRLDLAMSEQASAKPVGSRTDGPGLRRRDDGMGAPLPNWGGRPISPA
jgi:hypothetical protein